MRHGLLFVSTLVMHGDGRAILANGEPTRLEVVAMSQEVLAVDHAGALAVVVNEGECLRCILRGQEGDFHPAATLSGGILTGHESVG